MYKTVFLYAVSSAIWGAANGFKWFLIIWTPIPKRAERMADWLLPVLPCLPCEEELHDDELLNRFRSAEGRGLDLQEDSQDDEDESFPNAA